MLLPGQIGLYEEGTYYVLSSSMEIFKEKSHLQQFLNYMEKRAQLSSDLLVRIQCSLICVREMKPQNSMPICELLLQLSA